MSKVLSVAPKLEETTFTVTNHDGSNPEVITIQVPVDPNETVGDLLNKKIQNAQGWVSLYNGAGAPAQPLVNP